MATHRASKTHVTLKLTELEAETLRDILSATTNRGGLKLYAEVDLGLRSMALRRRFAAPSVTDPRD